MCTRSKGADWQVIITLLATGVAAWAQATTAPSGAPEQAKLDPEVDRILSRLEKREVHELRARVVWHQHYITDEAEDDLSKRGRLWYQKGDPVAKFMIHFEDQVSGRGERRKLDEKYLFDGCWYVELNKRTKTVTRREIRKPDDPADPYKVGEGVFPLPFGQKKADIVREFEVERVPPDEKDPPGTDRVRLSPREGTESGRTYKRLDFWVQREGKLAGLPVKVRVAKKKPTGQMDSYITVTFADVELNTGFSSSVFELKTPVGFHEEIERLRDVPPPAQAGVQRRGG
jgi:hypothetical protein